MLLSIYEYMTSILAWGTRTLFVTASRLSSPLYRIMGVRTQSTTQATDVTETAVIDSIHDLQTLPDVAPARYNVYNHIPLTVADVSVSVYHVGCDDHGRR
jgi:hypothetical protein